MIFTAGSRSNLASQFRIQGEPNLFRPVTVLSGAAHLLIPFPCARYAPHQISRVPCDPGSEHTFAHIVNIGQSEML